MKSTKPPRRGPGFGRTLLPDVVLDVHTRQALTQEVKTNGELEVSSFWFARSPDRYGVEIHTSIMLTQKRWLSTIWLWDLLINHVSTNETGVEGTVVGLFNPEYECGVMNDPTELFASKHCHGGLFPSFLPRITKKSMGKIDFSVACYLRRLLIVFPYRGPIVKWYYASMAWMRPGFNSPWVHQRHKTPAARSFVLLWKAQAYFCLSGAKGKNAEPGSRNFSVRKNICDHKLNILNFLNIPFIYKAS